MRQGLYNILAAKLQPDQVNEIMIKESKLYNLLYMGRISIKEYVASLEAELSTALLDK